MDDLFLQILDEIVVEMKFPLQGTIGDTLALTQEVQDLIQDIVKSHSLVPLRPPRMYLLRFENLYAVLGICTRYRRRYRV